MFDNCSWSGERAISGAGVNLGSNTPDRTAEMPTKQGKSQKLASPHKLASKWTKMTAKHGKNAKKTDGSISHGHRPPFREGEKWSFLQNSCARMDQFQFPKQQLWDLGTVCPLQGSKSQNREKRVSESEKGALRLLGWREMGFLTLKPSFPDFGDFDPCKGQTDS